jgi:hypothetical protein
MNHGQSMKLRVQAKEYSLLCMCLKTLYQLLRSYVTKWEMTKAMNHEVRKIGTDIVVTHFKILSQHFSKD